MKNKLMAIVLSAMCWIPAAVAAETHYPEKMTITDSTENLSAAGSLTQDLDLSVSFKASLIKQYVDDEDANLTMYGPAALLTYKGKFYANMSYLKGSGEGPNIDNLEKSDFDLRAGYLFHPRVAAYVGYKSIKFEFEDFYPEWNFKGPAVGLDGNFPLSDTGILLFFTLEYEFLTYSVSGGSGSYNYVAEETDTEGFLIEAGIAYSFQSLPRLSLTLGYKYQSYDYAYSFSYGDTSRIGGTPEGEVFNYGGTLSINYLF